MANKISIITINYNNALGLEKTIKSIQEQSTKVYEHIIIDGGSSDGSVDVIKKYASSISYWVSEKDNGIYNAMNKGINISTGDYLLFINSGDWMEKDALKKISDISFNVDIVFFNIYLYYNKNKIIEKRYPDTIDVVYFYYESLPHCASFIKSSLMKKNLYNENFKIVSDWEFFFKTIVIDNASYSHQNETIAYFDMEGISSNKENERLIHNEKKQIFENYLPELVNISLKNYSFQKNNILNQPIIEIIPEIKDKIKFQKILIKFIHVINRLYNIINKIR